MAEDKVCALIPPSYEVDQRGLLFFCPISATESVNHSELARPVVPEELQQDILHHYHKSVEGGHQRIGRLYQQVRANFYWRGLYRSVQRYGGRVWITGPERTTR